MKVILKEDVKNLGEEGDIVEVKAGYARNFLMPRGKVVPWTWGNVRILEQQQAAIEKRKAEKREAAKSAKEKIESMNLVLPVPAGDTGKLFGSVNNATIADALAKEGIEVERKRIEIVGTHVKMVGNYTAKIRLYGDEVAVLNFTVEGVSTTTTTKTKKGDEPVASVQTEEAKADPVVEEAVQETADENAQA